MYQFCWYVVWVTETLFTQQKLIWNLDTPVKTCLMRCLMRMGTPCENVLEILAVVVLLSPISSVRGSHWGMYEWRVTHRSRNIFGESWTSYESHTHILRYLGWVMYIMTLPWLLDDSMSHGHLILKHVLRVMCEWRVTSEDVLDVTRRSYMTGTWLVDSRVRVTSEDALNWDLHDSSNHLRVMNHARVMHESRVTRHQSRVTSRRCNRMRQVDLTESSISHWVTYESRTSDEPHVPVIHLTNSIRSTWLGSRLGVAVAGRGAARGCTTLDPAPSWLSDLHDLPRDSQSSASHLLVTSVYQWLWRRCVCVWRIYESSLVVIECAALGEWCVSTSEWGVNESCTSWLLDASMMRIYEWWHDSFICETWLIHMWDMTHSYVRHDNDAYLRVMYAWGLTYSRSRMTYSRARRMRQVDRRESSISHSPTHEWHVRVTSHA